MCPGRGEETPFVVKANRKQKGKLDVEMPPEVVEKTKGRYTEVFKLMTGENLEDVLKAIS
jgi:hypothetical protein